MSAAQNGHDHDHEPRKLTKRDFETDQAVRIAVEHMCPVAYLSDGSLANGAEPWRLPAIEDLQPIHPGLRTEVEGFAPFLRDARLVRPWAVPGTPGLEHRIGGIEKEDVTGNISYDPDNHEHMTRTRQAKIDKIADRLPPAKVDGPESGDVLIVGWGGTYGSLRQASIQLRGEGHAVGHLHLRYLSPLQSNVGALLARYRRVVVAELNRGQLRSILRDKYLVDARGLNKIQGKPFKVREVVDAVRKLLPAGSARELHA